MSTLTFPDPAAFLKAFVDLVANAVVARLQAGLGAGGTSGERPPRWYDQDSAPIARRTYLALARSGAVPSKRVGKTVLVEQAVLDAWIAENGTAPLPASPAPQAPAEPSDEDLLRGRGIRPAPGAQRGRKAAGRGANDQRPRAQRRTK